MYFARPIAALVLAVAPLLAQEQIIQPAKPERTTETRTVALAPGSTLKVENVNGFIRVEAWDRNEVQFSGDFKPSSKDEHVKVVMGAGDHSLVIKGVYPKNSGWHFHYRSPECDMTLKVPRELKITLETVNGAINLRGTSGSASLESVNGSINLAQVQGAIKLETVNGGIRGEALDSRGQALSAESVNGGIDLQVAGLKGRLKATTVNGGIHFKPAGAQDVEIKPHKVTATFPGGNETISLSTVNGGISLQ